MSLYNDDVLSNLSSSEKVDVLPAILFTKDQEYSVFVQNPLRINISNKANFESIKVPGLDAERQVYTNSSSRVISLPGIIFDTYALGLDLTQVIEQIEVLMRPIAEINRPEYVGFSWGKQSFYPCVLTSFKYDTDLFLAGNPARCKVDIVLEETYDPIISSQNSDVPIELDVLSQVDLTDRELEDGLSIVQQSIDANPGIIGDFQEYSRYLGGRATLDISTDGIVQIVDGIMGNKIIGSFDPVRNIFNNGN